jgi:proteasome accessory factor B
LIDLLLLLLHQRLPLPWSEIRKLPAYQAVGRDVASVQRQFERDKEDLRALGVPLEYVEPIEEEGEGGYVIDRRRYFLPPISFTEDEAVALAMAEGIAGRMAQALGEDAFAAWTKLVCLPGFPTAVHGGLGRRVHVAPAPPVDPRERALLDAIRQALADNRRLRIRYHTRGASDAKTRVIDPYGLLIRRGVAYVIGHDHARSDVLMFRVSRIESLDPAPVKAGEPDFTVPETFSLARFAERQPWEFGSEPPIHVTVRVEPRIAWLVERTVGRRAAISLEKDGSITVQVTATDRDALLRWVLGMGRAAEIVRPAAWRASVRALAAQVAERHTGAPGSELAGESSRGARETRPARRARGGG